jgi:hypothetical protein
MTPRNKSLAKSADKHACKSVVGYPSWSPSAGFSIPKGITLFAKQARWGNPGRHLRAPTGAAPNTTQKENEKLPLTIDRRALHNYLSIVEGRS